MAPRKKKFKDTSANRQKRWRKKSPMARYGKSNGSWKGGKSAHYYRRKADAGKNEVVHHKSGGKGGRGKPGVHNARTARKSNLKKVTAPREKPKKRPGRHKKSPNKHEKRMGKFRRK